MIEPGDTVFPNNVQALLVARIPGAVDADLVPLQRPLRPSDGNQYGQAVGVFPLTATDDSESIEIQSLQPTLKRYQIVLQSMVKHTNEESGTSIHSILSSRLWNMFYRDPVLHAGLTVLSVSAFNGLERMQRRGVTMQRYLSNELEGVFHYTSWLEVWIETETTTV